MAVYHKKYTNTGLNAMGVTYQIGDDGRLSPDPSPEDAKALSMLANYTIKEDPKPAKKEAPAPKKTEEREVPRPSMSKKKAMKKKSSRGE